MTSPQNLDDIEKQITEKSQTIKDIIHEMSKRVVGQSHVANRLVMALLVQGHVLLEGLPGLAKTTCIKALADATSLQFRRVQFTPDLLPADILGTQIYNPKQGDFQIKQGPIFTHLLLADEINRAPAKVQSALLEAMQEKQVTIGDTTFALDKPFLVMATQNPVEQEGTYPLPEAQVDRFLFKVNLTYGTLEEEQEIIARYAAAEEAALQQVANVETILECRKLVKHIHVSDKIRKYIADLVFATRFPERYDLPQLAKYIQVGASPRASINLERVARVNALFEGRGFVTPQDVKDVAEDILSHRLMLTFEAEADEVSSREVVQNLLKSVDVP